MRWVRRLRKSPIFRTFFVFKKGILLIKRYHISKEVITIRNKYPFTKQTGLKDCAAASLQMIIRYYHGYVSLDELNEMMNTTRNGTSAYDLIETAKKLGFEGGGSRVKFEELAKTNLIFPLVVHTVIDNKYKHFMVIYKINFKKNYLIIADPQTKVKKISLNEFQKIYSGIIITLYPIRPIVKNNQVLLKDIFISIIIKYKKEIIHLLSISLISMLVSLISSFYIKIMIDNIDQSIDYIKIIFYVFSFINLLKITSNYLKVRLLIFINQKIDVELNLDAFSKVINLPYHYYKNRTTGEILSKLIDLDKVYESINKIIITLFVDLPFTLFSTIILIIINPYLFLLSLLFLFVYVSIIILSKKTISSKTETCYQNKTELISYMQESINGFETVKGINIENKIIKKHELKYVKYLKSIIRLDNLLNMQNYLKEIVNVINELVILYVGSLLVKNNTISLGTLLAFNSIQIFFFTPIRNMIDLDINLIEAKKALKKVYEMFCKVNKQGENKKLDGNIEIDNLSYYYDSKKILDSINLKINKGEKVIIIGESGSGKSTFLKTLIGYLEVKRSMIKFNDVDINDIGNIKENISYISQNEVLFTDTIYNNICIYNNSDRDYIIKECYVDEIIKDESLGYNMVLEENGFNISGGQKQRIILARTLMKNSNIVLIDEGLNQIDINLERRILKNIFKRFSDKTIIIVSHRKENMDLFDHLIEMRNGCIVQDVVRDV